MATFIIKPHEWRDAALLASAGTTPGMRQMGRIRLQDIELKSMIIAAEQVGDIPRWERLMALWEAWKNTGIWPGAAIRAVPYRA